MFRIVICDDEREKTIAIYNVLSNCVKNIGTGGEIEIFTAHPEKLINYNADERYTYLFFLDITYKAISGIDIALKLRLQYKDIYIVFVTTYPNLVYMAINQNVMPSGFLTKPPVENELKRVFMSVYEYYKNNKQLARSMLTIAVGSDVYKFFYDEIYYIESLNKKINIYTKSKRVSCYSSLSYLQEELGNEFIRCHKSFLINKKRIKNVFLSNMIIEMEDGSMVSISRTYKSAIKEFVNGGGV